MEGSVEKAPKRMISELIPKSRIRVQVCPPNIHIKLLSCWGKPLVLLVKRHKGAVGKVKVSSVCADEGFMEKVQIGKMLKDASPPCSVSLNVSL